MRVARELGLCAFPCARSLLYSLRCRRGHGVTAGLMRGCALRDNGRIVRICFCFCADISEQECFSVSRIHPLPSLLLTPPPLPRRRMDNSKVTICMFTKKNRACITCVIRFPVYVPRYRKKVQTPR